MKSKLIYYSLIKSLSDRKKNILGFYNAIVLKSLKLYGESCNETDLSKFISSEFNILIPSYTIKTILSYLAREQLLTINKENSMTTLYSITGKGIDEVDNYDSLEEEKEKQLTEFYESVKKYLEGYRIYLNELTFEETLTNFILNNISNIDIFKEIYSNENITKGEDPKFHYYFNQYLTEIYQNDREQYALFNEIVKGLMVSSVMKEETLFGGNFIDKHLVIYLDTSIIISLLELHHEVFNVAVRQMIDMARSYENVSLRVLSFTLDKFINLLNTYKSVKHNYFIQFPVDNVFYFLKERGYEDSDINFFIKELPLVLENMEIEIEDKPLVRYEDLGLAGIDIYNDVYSYYSKVNTKRPDHLKKNDNNLDNSVIQDTNIILHINSMRNPKICDFSNCRAIMVTSSFYKSHLSSIRAFNDNTFPEIIQDQDLTNILWLNDPSSKVDHHLKHWLSLIHSKNFLDNTVWFKFVSNLKKMLESGEINESKYAFILSNNQILREILLNTDTDEIDYDYINTIAKYAKVENDKRDEKLEEQSRLNEKLNERLNSSDRVIKKLDTDNEELESKNREYLNKISDIDDLRMEANNYAKIFFQTSLILPFAILYFTAVIILDSVFGYDAYNEASKIFALLGVIYFAFIFFSKKIFKPEFWIFLKEKILKKSSEK